MKEILNMDFVDYIDKYKINNNVTLSIILLAGFYNGNFSSVDSWSPSERMFAKDGYTERWYQASECTYSAVVEMNHPETQTIRQD